MPRIKVLSPDETRERLAKMGAPAEGFVKGVTRIMLVDPQIAAPVYQIYNYLNLRRPSPLTRLQREMVATVVNGLIGGAP
jgi:hypothetical protein